VSREVGRLKDEIKQSKPFGTLEEEVFLNLQRTADALTYLLGETLKSAELTPSQYNVLRILKGAGPDGVPCREVSERLVTRDPDVTRLLDRMEARELVSRSRDSRDRRVVLARISERGLRHLDGADKAVAGLLARQLAPLGPGRLAVLNDLLEVAREPRE
jgi:DNA-binding MarR family transcriptional regulator